MQSTTEPPPAKLYACGHPASDHGPITTGTAHIPPCADYPDGAEICCVCADEWEQKQLTLASTTNWTGYLGEHAITNWTGNVIARILWRTSTPTNFGGRLTRFRATTPDGREWYGTSPGTGMYCRMHVCKHKSH